MQFSLIAVMIRKYQEVSQLCQSLQAAQSSCSDHIIKIKVRNAVASIGLLMVSLQSLNGVRICL